MKGRVIVLDHLADREAAASMVDGVLNDFLIDTTDDPRPGAIYRAIADRPLKGQGGMMVRLPDRTGFLRQVKGLAPGQSLLVQVTGYSEPDKAIPVTSRLIFKSRFAIVTPGAEGINVSRQIRDEEARVRLLEIAHDTFEGPGGLILRSAATDASDEDLIEDIQAMADLAAAVLADADGSDPEALTEGDGPHVLAWRDWTAPAQIVTEPDGFRDHGVLDALERLRDARVPLDGGHMFIEPTRALVAVDVNTGSDTSPAAGLKANLAAARSLPHALRLRGLGGQITVDFAPMSKAQRRQVESALRTSLRNDLVETALVGWTPLGHYELQRKRERRPLDLPESF